LTHVVGGHDFHQVIDYGRLELFKKVPKQLK